MSEIFHIVAEKLTFLHLQRNSGFVQSRYDLVKVTYLLIYGLGVDDYVVDVDEARFPFEMI